MTVLPNAIYRFNAIPIKLPMAFFTELEQKISQFIWKHKRSWINKAVLRKTNEAGEIKLSDFRLLQSCTGTKAEIYRPMEQDREPRDKPTHYGYLIFDKEKRICNGAKPASSISGAGKTGQLHAKE